MYQHNASRYEINNKVGYFEKQLSINKNNKNVFFK